MDEKVLKDPTVQLLKSVGFSDDYIEKAIASGEIILKSENAAAAGDHESETKEEKDIDKLEKEAVEKEEKVKDDEKDTAEDKNAEGLQKSIEETFTKSFGVIVPLFEGLQKSIEGLKEEVSSLKNQTPTFRSEGLNNLSAIQKSMSLEKDEEGRTEINIITQRAIASQAISKALDGVKDDAIKKSLESDALAFMMNPEAEMVGEDLARYMYGKGIKFVK
jgi:hypothetical protein